MAAAQVNSLATTDSQLLLELTIPAAFAGAFVFEALPIGSATWFPVAGVQQDTLSVVTASQSSPMTPSAVGQTLGFKFDVSGCQAFRVWCPALANGPVAVQETSGSFFSQPPSGAALSMTVMLAVLWQLQHLTFLVAQSDEKVAASWAPNPILPSGLAPATWDVTG